MRQSRDLNSKIRSPMQLQASSYPMPVQERIINAACQHFNISEDQLKQKSILTEVAYRRHVCGFLLKENTNLTFQAIARRLDYKNRNTVWAGVEKIKLHRNIYKQVTNDIKEISRMALL